MELIKRSRFGLLLSFIALLAACGGSSSGGNTLTNSNAAPVANAGVSQSVDELSVVTLDGSASSDPDGDAITYSWTQLSGSTVSLSSTITAGPTFVAPDVLASTGSEVLQFRLTVNDGSRNSTADVSITTNDIGIGANSAPIASAGPDQAVGELESVALDASASSDPDGDALTFLWAQTGGTTVSLSNVNDAQPTFTSPDITGSDTLTFEVTVDDGADSAADSVNVVVTEMQALVSISGQVFYEFVNPNLNCRGLNFADIDVRPIRAAPVQLLDASDTVIAEAVLGDDGSYSFSGISANTDVRVRVRAELQRSGGPSWDVQVRDNTSDTAQPLTARPLYVKQWPLFNTGTADISAQDFTAVTGWGITSYTGTREAAPFAILDSVYSGMKLILTADSNAAFSPLDAYWSVNNTLASPSDIDAGELSSSFYTNSGLFLLGDANTDTEEFDDHVSVHEWGHYFEDNFSRSDSLGGPHRIGASIDARLAFGEGWATGLAGMALNEPVYCDTGPAGSVGGFGINTETENGGPQGFYNEMSVATLLYDLWDTDNDGTDNSSIGFAPIFDVMTGPQASTRAFTTIFSFATELRASLNGADQTFLESQLTRENIDLVGLDEFATTQTVVPAGATDVLPLYTDITPGGGAVGICINNDFDAFQEGNKLGEYRYFRFNVTQTGRYRIIATTTGDGAGNAPSEPAPGFDCEATFAADPDDPLAHTYSDPDMIAKGGQSFIAVGQSCTPNSESMLTITIGPGDYVFDLNEFRYGDEDTVAGYPDRTCFDVTVERE